VATIEDQQDVPAAAVVRQRDGGAILRPQGEVGGDVAHRHPLGLDRRQLEAAVGAQLRRRRWVIGARRREDQDSTKGGGASESGRANAELLCWGIRTLILTFFPLR
jgi:hypothetical protein